MNWYIGKTLLESFDEIKPSKRNINGPLEISVYNAEKITGVGTVIYGKILSGKIKTNMEIYLPFIKHDLLKKECKSIEIHHNNVDEAITGDIIGINIKGVSYRDIKNDKMFLVFEPNAMNRMQKAETLRVKILILNKKTTIKVGSAFQFFVIL